MPSPFRTALRTTTWTLFALVGSSFMTMVACGGSSPNTTNNSSECKSDDDCKGSRVGGACSGEAANCGNH